ncbi:hypothetical protein L1987_33169 [Smallanthus sonchifolius]|uniref:Uncharacterized protein n=1 Tax=Smallanthus sonchifolius TaxID=185202 RepID=A0ACB9HRM1_9ASTR|nr:hypothetical protein L1987_33169 [Smallanthus sonchifolius]
MDSLGRSCCRLRIGRGEYHHVTGYKLASERGVVRYDEARLVPRNRSGGKREAPTGANARSVLEAAACSRSGGRKKYDVIDQGPHSRPVRPAHFVSSKLNLQLAVNSDVVIPIYGFLFS